MARRRRFAAALCAILAPEVAWPVCEGPYYDTAPVSGWCAGIGGFTDSDFAIAGQANELVMVERGFSGAFMERKRGSGRFLLGLDYRYRNYDADEAIGGNLDLYTLTLAPLWVVQGPDREWLMRFAVSRATSSNRNLKLDVHSDEVFYSAAVVARQPLDNSRVLVFGFAHDHLFGRPHTYPLFGLERRLNASWQLGLVVPAPYLRWRRDRQWSAQFQLRPAGSRWHVFDDRIGRNFDTTVKAMRLSADLGWRFARSWQLETTLGVGFDRSLSTAGFDGRRFVVKPDSALYGAIALFHRPAPD